MVKDIKFPDEAQSPRPILRFPQKKSLFFTNFPKTYKRRSAARHITSMKLPSKILTAAEMSAVKAFLLGKPIIRIAENAIKADEKGSAIENAKKWAKIHSQEILRPDIGKVVFSARGVKNSIAHKFGQRKLDAIQAIPAGIKAGKVVSISDDLDGSPMKNIILVAPIQIGDNEKSFLCIRLVRKTNSTDSRLYVHEVFDIGQIKNKAIPFQTPGTDLTVRPQRGIAMYVNILRNILGVK